MAWDTQRMVRSSTPLMDQQQQRLVQQLSGVGAAAQPYNPAAYPYPGYSYNAGSGITLPGASQSSNAIASFANLAPGAPQYPSMGSNETPEQMAANNAAAYGTNYGGQASPPPATGGTTPIPYSPAAIAGGMTQGDIWSNPAFANGIAAAGNSGAIGGASDASRALIQQQLAASAANHAAKVAAGTNGMPPEQRAAMVDALQKYNSGQIGGAAWGAGIGALGKPAAPAAPALAPTRTLMPAPRLP